jgi:hypothetical protein
MVRSALLVLTGFICIGTAAAQSDKDVKPATQTESSASSSLPAGAAIRAVITSSIDSKKIKSGDKVTAETTAATKIDNNIVMPSGAKLVGHVTQAAARSKGDSFSSVGIAFDKAILKHNQEIPLNVSILALASAPQPASAPDMSQMGAPSMGQTGAPSTGRPGTPNTPPPPGTPSGNVTNTVGNTDTNNAISGKGAVGGLDNTGQLTPDSRGVFGLQGIGLAAGTVGTNPGTVITSTGKEVRLDSGTQLLLITQAPVQAAN